MTENALNHRFRRLRAQAVLIREAAKQNLDMKNLDPDENSLPGTQGDIDVSRTTTLSLHHASRPLLHMHPPFWALCPLTMNLLTCLC